MILISSEANDFSTNDVIDWLLFYNRPFKRINLEDDYNINFNLKKIIIKVNGSIIDVNLIKSYWYRRGKISIKKRAINNIDLLREYSVEEEETLNQYLNKVIGNKKLNTHDTIFLNKLIVSDLASEVNMLVPKSYLLDNKQDVEKILIKHPIITKGILQSNSFQNRKNNDLYISYTNRITKKDLNKIPNTFFPSLFQQEIIKKYELRVFFLEKRFWSMAIFSQSNSKTMIDFRRYDNKKPSRTVPYILSDEIKSKLLKLTSLLNINSGSIDLIVEKTTNNIFFLEINPIGQFGMTSYPCNYNIEKHIANFLSS